MSLNTQTSSEPLERLAALIIDSAECGLLKRAVLSKSLDKTITRATVTPKIISGRPTLQLEKMCIADTAVLADNSRSAPVQAKHENIFINRETHDCLLDILRGYAQINLLSEIPNRDCEYRRSKGGKETIFGESKLRAELCRTADRPMPVRLQIGNDREKQHILRGDEDFLKLLGISDDKGRVHDKKQAKFRQINRFLEIVRDTETQLPSMSDYVLHICDLCCGKSYLSFAVYYYFTEIRHRKVIMRGVDMKADVIEECNHIAKMLNMDGLSFVCADITLYDFSIDSLSDSPSYVDMVVSLHACDTATDMVLAKACEWQAKVILSTPCCHHELNKKLRCPELEFILEHSMLRQKFCDAATDALRLKLLESNGYEVAALELIDPDQTPKNILLRGVLKYSPDSRRAKNAANDYTSAKTFLLGDGGI